jgi:hypothetical protein
MDTTSVEQTTPTSSEKEKEPEIQLSDIEITNENMALNVIVSFVNLAQKRGAFSLPESSKIWECIQMFSKKKE